MVALAALEIVRQQVKTAASKKGADALRSLSLAFILYMAIFFNRERKKDESHLLIIQHQHAELGKNHNLTFNPISLEAANFFCYSAGDALSNYVNPRHESTAALVGLMTDVPCAGGFLAYEEGMEILVILPPRDLMSRDGEEIDIADLETCQFWIVSWADAPSGASASLASLAPLW